MPRHDLVPLGAERHSGIETRLPLLFSEGVSKGRITLNEFVALTSTNHARSTACIRAKARSRSAPTPTSCCGTHRKETIARTALHHGADYTPWEGFEVTGWPVMTIARGRVVDEDGGMVGDKGAGDVLSRGR